ncbi:uncharacterized protein V6R79_000430 [Siganus canaliculatus]
MSNLKLSFLLFVSLCFTSEEFLLKTIRNKEDAVEICTNATLGIMTIICKIRTQRSSGEECRLLYRHGQELKHECGSRFMLRIKNQTAFLYMTGLTPVDSGSCICECVHSDGTDNVTLNIAVEGPERTTDSVETLSRNTTDSVEILLPGVSVGVGLFIIMVGVVLTLIHKRSRHSRGKPQLKSSPPYTGEEDIEPYSTFIQKENGLYSTTRLPVWTTNA